MPVLQLDRVYVRGFDVLSAQVLHGPRWARLSDHAPIVAELHLSTSKASADTPPLAALHGAPLTDPQADAHAGSEL